MRLLYSLVILRREGAIRDHAVQRAVVARADVFGGPRSEVRLRSARPSAHGERIFVFIPVNDACSLKKPWRH